MSRNNQLGQLELFPKWIDSVTAEHLAKVAYMLARQPLIVKPKMSADTKKQENYDKKAKRVLVQNP